MNVKELLREVSYPIELFDKNGNMIYQEWANGRWYKQEYNDKGEEIYYENSNGTVVDKRPAKELTLSEICKELGYNVKVVK